LVLHGILRLWCALTNETNRRRAYGAPARQQEHGGDDSACPRLGASIAVWCARPGGEHHRAQAHLGYAFWQREPGSDDELYVNALPEPPARVAAARALGGRVERRGLHDCDREPVRPRRATTLSQKPGQTGSPAAPKQPRENLPYNPAPTHAQAYRPLHSIAL